jgi:transposase-like protein
LIAYYRMQDIETVAQCYDISPKTLKKWIK